VPVERRRNDRRSHEQKRRADHAEPRDQNARWPATELLTRFRFVRRPGPRRRAAATTLGARP
jgi:hypothetical protein